MKKVLLTTLFLFMMVSSLPAGGPIRIMPLGNSITAGEHNGFPAWEERSVLDADGLRICC